MIGRIAPFMIAGLQAAGLVILVKRYPYTRNFLAGFLSLILIFLFSLQSVFAAVGRLGSYGLFLVVQWGWLLGALLAFAFFMTMKRPLRKFRLSSPLGIASIAAACLALIRVVAFAVAEDGGIWVVNSVMLALLVPAVLGALALVGAVAPQDEARDEGDGRSTLRTLGIILGSGVVSVLVMLSARAVWKLSFGQWAGVINRSLFFFAGLVFLGCALAVSSRFPRKGYATAGVAGFVLLGFAQLATFVQAMGDSTAARYSPWVLGSVIAAWGGIVFFLNTVPRRELATVRAWAGFDMTDARWAGVIGALIGLVICGWQLNSLTRGGLVVWFIGGVVPIPLILIGLLVVAGSVVTFVEG